MDNGAAGKSNEAKPWLFSFLLRGIRLMGHQSFLTSLAFVTLCACGGLMEGCDSGSSSGAAASIKMDGTLGKWRGKTPAWDNGPVPPDKLAEHFYIQKVFFDNDERYLYVFIQCVPTVQDRYKLTQKTGSLGEIYLDGESNPETGSPARGGDADPHHRGYKVRLSLPTGVFSSTSGKSGAFAAYDVYLFSGRNLDDNGGFNERMISGDQRSTNADSLIVDGKDGVELAVPLKLLGIARGADARVLIKSSYISTSYEVRRAEQFTTYHCR